MNRICNRLFAHAGPVESCRVILVTKHAVHDDNGETGLSDQVVSTFRIIFFYRSLRTGMYIGLTMRVVQYSYFRLRALNIIKSQYSSN